MCGVLEIFPAVPQAAGMGPGHTQEEATAPTPGQGVEKFCHDLRK